MKLSKILKELRNKDITEVWDVTKEDLVDINKKILDLEEDLNMKYQGRYFDYQLVENFFSDLPDFKKAMIFVYGQLVHDRIYKKSH